MWWLVGPVVIWGAKQIYDAVTEDTPASSSSSSNAVSIAKSNRTKIRKDEVERAIKNYRKSLIDKLKPKLEGFSQLTHRNSTYTINFKKLDYAIMMLMDLENNVRMMEFSMPETFESRPSGRNTELPTHPFAFDHASARHSFPDTSCGLSAIYSGSTTPKGILGTSNHRASRTPFLVDSKMNIFRPIDEVVNEVLARANMDYGDMAGINHHNEYHESEDPFLDKLKSSSAQT